MADEIHPHVPSRRAFLKGAACATAALLTGCEQDQPTEQPNILWITCEDMSATLGCYGDDYATTPNIDALAKQSVRYTRAFATAPVCSPVRSCLITGCYASSLGTPNLRSAFPIPNEMTGFPSYLRKAGYYCTNNVKTDYNTSNAQTIIKASWDECSNKAHWRGRREGQPFFAIFNDMVSHQSRSMVWPYDKFKKDVQSKLDPSERHDPAKVEVWPYYPDTPIVRRTIARYYDCVSVMDKNTGAILKQLEEDGLAEDTIVFFYSDHGSGMPRHKRLLLDSGLHVPLMVRFPKKYQHLAPAKPGETTNRLVSFVDFPPTVLGLAGLPVPNYMQGRAFLGKEKKSSRKYVYGARDRVDEAYDVARCVRDDNWLYIRNYFPHVSYNQPSWYSDQGEIRDEITALAAAGKLTSDAQRHYAGPTRAVEELYDTAADPKQIRNLASDPQHRGRLEKMRKRLREWLLEIKDLGFLPETDMAARSKGSTPFAMARQGDAYPLEKILDAAELVGTGTGSIARQTELLKDADAAVRYWAAVGLRAQGRQALLAVTSAKRALDEAPPPVRVLADVGLGAQGKQTLSAVTALKEALNDAAPAVRIEAAWALADLGEPGKPLDLLAKEVLTSDRRVALRAARALQMLGPRAKPALPAMRKALATAKKGPGDGSMFIKFSLEPAVEALSK
jgi:uncharacterized sulfatase